MILKNKIGELKGYLDLFHQIADDIEAIQELVQSNPSFFQASIGESCHKAARRKLEALVKEYNENESK